MGYLWCVGAHGTWGCLQSMGHPWDVGCPQGVGHPWHMRYQRCLSQAHCMGWLRCIGWPRSAWGACCECSAYSVQGTRHGWGARGACGFQTAAPPPPHQGSWPAAAFQLFHMAPSMIAPQCRAPPVPSTVPSGRTASHPEAVWGAWQTSVSAAPCMSPALFAACGHILLKSHPAPWLGGWLGVL